MLPDISCLMPVYNTAPYLAASLDGILRQTFSAFELIIVDDGSTDGSREILEQYAAADKRIRLTFNNANRGMGYSLNKALGLARARVIARTDSDDVSFPRRLEKQYAYLQAHPDCVVLGSQLEYINPRDEYRGRSYFPVEDASIKKSIFYYHPVADPTVMFNKALIPEGVLRYDESLKLAADLDLLFRLYHYGRFAALNEPLVYVRIREGSLTNRSVKRTFYYLNTVRQRAIREYGFKPSMAVRVGHLLQRTIINLLPSGAVYGLYQLSKKILYRRKGTGR